MKKSEFILNTMNIIAICLWIFGLGILAGCFSKHQTKYEYYTLDGEKGTTYKCEVKEKVQCEIDGNMVEVAQFSEEE